MSPQDISTAIPSGGWILGYVEDRAKAGYVPWVPLTWGDRGWVDDEDNVCTPSVWVPLPDPQPEPTGWVPPEGTIHVDEITGDGWTSNGKPITVPYRWSVYILRVDGSYDEYRDTRFYASYPDAERKAGEFQKRFGLPIKVKFLDPKVTPLFPNGTVQ